jgi:hypothetical protein
MRIVIEIDGKQVVATDVSHLTPAMDSDLLPSAEPPPELLQAARALGAQSAGPAAFVKPAGVAARRTAAFATASLAPLKEGTGDLDAGTAAAVAAPASAVPTHAATRPAKKRGANKRRRTP